MRKKYFIFLCLFWIFPCSFLFPQNPDSRNDTTAESDKGIIVISGQILGGNPLVAIPGVHIFCEKYNCSAFSDSMGIFSITVPEHNSNLLLIHHLFDGFLLNGPFYKSIKNKIFMLEKKIIQLSMVEISANIMDTLSAEHIQYDRITPQELKNISATTTASLLDDKPSVFVQKTQGAGGSPTIRGLGANKILLMVDGIRLNNAIYRGRYLHNVLSLDESIIKQIDVIYGPSAIYGSDALGGIIHLKTKDAVMGKVNNKVNSFGNGYIKGTTAVNELSSHLDFNLGWNKFASLTSITIKSFGDIHKGKKGNENMGDVNYMADTLTVNDSLRDIIINNTNPRIQVKTGYKQIALLQKFNFMISENIISNVNIQYNEQFVVNRFDKLQEDIDSVSAKYVEWYYSPQKRTMVSNHWQITNKYRLADQIVITLAYQNIEEGRVQRKFADNYRIIEEEKVSIYDFYLRCIKADLGSRKHIFSYGADMIFENVNSKAFQQNINNPHKYRVSARYPDNSKYNHGGAYAEMRTHLNNSLTLNTGGRFSFVDLKAPFKDDIYNQYNSIFNNVEQLFYAPSGSVGITKKGSIYWVNASFSSGFRAPNVDDLSKIGEGSGNMFEVPNPDLKPEYITTSELGLEIGNKLRKIFSSITANTYYSQLQNAILRTPATIDGNPFFIDNDDTLFYYHQTNSGKAYIYGVSSEIELANVSSWKIVSGINYTKGWDVSQNQPMIGIPPLKAKVYLKKIWGAFETTLEAVYNAAKKKEELSDIELADNRIPADGNPEWTVLNFRNSWTIGNYSRLNFAVENIMDVNYRIFGSGINSPGRNFILAYYFSF